MKGFVVHETDERMFFLKDMLTGLKPSVTTHIFAPNIQLNVKLSEDFECGDTVIGGKATEETEALFDCNDITFFDMMKNEKFQAENARMTAEGTLAALINRSLRSISDMKALIIGFGRTGAALTRILDRLGVRFDIASTASLRPSYAFAENVIETSHFDFAPYDAVVNTVPHSIITDKDVMTFKYGSVYIDLASKPALNLEYARYLGVDADIYPALPAKTCPISAAKAMKDYISEVIK